MVGNILESNNIKALEENNKTIIYKMKKIYQKPSFRTADIQPETFLDLSQGQQAEDPINSAKGNSLDCEEKTTEWKNWDNDDDSFNSFSGSL